MPLKSFTSVVLILTLMMCMSGEVSCNETHRSGPVIDINLQYQANNDLSNSFNGGCSTLVAKMTTDGPIQTFMSLSRAKHSFINI
jgi:hypothetical protein